MRHLAAYLHQLFPPDWTIQFRVEARPFCIMYLTLNRTTWYLCPLLPLWTQVLASKSRRYLRMSLMPTYARSRQIVVEDLQVGVYHCIARMCPKGLLLRPGSVYREGLQSPYRVDSRSATRASGALCHRGLWLFRDEQPSPSRAPHSTGHRRSMVRRRNRPTMVHSVASPVEALRRLQLRASNQGFLPIQVEHYVMLLDWTGRELRADKRGAIPEHLASIVDRLGINRSTWVETVRGFGRLFKQAAGRPRSLVDAASRRSRRWFQGKNAARIAFV